MRLVREKRSYLLSLLLSGRSWFDEAKQPSCQKPVHLGLSISLKDGTVVTNGLTEVMPYRVL